MHRRFIAYSLFLALAAGAGACATPRTAAATQKTPAAFDPAQSEAKALEAVDTMLATLGGVEMWNQVKQIRWDVKYYMSDELNGFFSHSWDIWNGRHRFEFAAPDELAKDEPVLTFAMYNLFDRSKGFVANTANPHQNAPAADRERLVAFAYENWQRDAYQLSMLYKLRDPGVILSYSGERQDFFGLCKPACLDIKVTFAPEVGTDTYHVLINTESNMPEVVEKVLPTGKLGLRVGDWIEVDGLKFPGSLANLGAEEKFVFENIRVGEPEDELYVPQVRE